LKLLLIEDEATLAREVLHYLQGESMLCEWASNFEIAQEKLGLYEYDCILLDITLPKGNGLTLLEALKKEGKESGVIIISARNSLDDKIKGLQLGADDYLAKPFHLAELLARIQAIVRRRSFNGNVLITYGAANIDVVARQASVGKQHIDLTRKELDLLLFLIATQGRVISKENIAENLSGDAADFFDSHDFIYAHIKNLKRKMAQAGAPLALKNVYGLGYKLESAHETT
jgi:DNA-binding response OmpR family regulator